MREPTPVESRTAAVFRWVREHRLAAWIIGVVTVFVALVSPAVILLVVVVVLVVMRLETPSQTAARKLKASTPVTWGLARYLSGDLDDGLEQMRTYVLSLGRQGMTVWEPLYRSSGRPAPTEQTPLWQVEWESVTYCEASGRGAETRGGGFMGGGIGLEGAAVGIAAASILNAASSRTRVDSHLLVETRVGEQSWQFLERAPDEVSRWLAPWRSLQRRAAAAAPHPLHAARPVEPAVPSAGSRDVIASLVRLKGLRDDGVIDEHEFRAVKKRLLDH